MMFLLYYIYLYYIYAIPSIHTYIYILLYYSNHCLYIVHYKAVLVGGHVSFSRILGFSAKQRLTSTLLTSAFGFPANGSNIEIVYIASVDTTSLHRPANIPCLLVLNAVKRWNWEEKSSIIRKTTNVKISPVFNICRSMCFLTHPTGWTGRVAWLGGSSPGRWHRISRYPGLKAPQDFQGSRMVHNGTQTSF